MKKLFTVNINPSGSQNTPFKLQSSKSCYIAASGKDQTVNVFDRHGEKKIEISLPGEVVHMAWDLEGDNLAIIDDKTSLVTLWDSLSFKLGQINTGLKDHLSVICWSGASGRLAVGSEKGNLVIYNHKTSKKVSLLGKHLRRISCAAWNKNNLLALASEDMVISVNSPEGDLLRQNGVRDIPSDLQFAEVRRPESFTGSENSISCVLGSKNLFILSLDESESPIELAFQTRYGDIVSYHWFGDGYIMIGFTLGYFIVISTQKSEIGKEIYQVCDHKDGLWDIAVSPVLNRCATAGDHCVKIHDLLNVRELLAIIEIEEDRRPGRETQTTFRNNRGAFQLQWSDDGQLMAVSTQRQLLHVFLSQLPMLASVVSSGTANLTARLTSLLEVTVEQLPFSKTPTPIDYFRTPQVVNVTVEPTFISLSSKYLAVGMNNHAWFYGLTEKGFEVVSDYDYLDVVTNVSVNDTYAAACGPSGKLTLHWIDPKTFPTKDGLRNEIMRASPAAAVRNNLFPMTTREQRMFPDCSKNGSRQANMKITGFRLTADFLIYATDTGQLTHFLLEDWANLHEYQHKTGIRSIHPNSKGTRVALIDDQAGAFVYNPVINCIIELPEFPATATEILWDLEENENPLLVAFDNTRLTVYRYFIHGCLLTTQMRSASNNSKHNIVNDSPNKTSKATNNLDIISGQCRAVGTTRIPYGHIPLSVAWGEVCLLSPTGRLITQLLATHAFRAHIRGGGTGTDEQMELNKVAEMETQLPTACTQNIEDQKPGQTRNRSVKRQQSSADLNKLTLTDLQTYFDQAMRAGCFDDAWVFAERMDSERHWNQLGHTCLRVMQFELAIRAFRKSQNTGLVLSLQRIQRIEDELLLAGYVAMILKEFDQAQELFLVSSRPLAALEMRRDLLHWDTALQLARTLAPHEIPAICREYAVEMEYIGDYVNALMHFEQALSQPDTTAESDAFNEHRNPSSDGQWVKRNGDLFKSDMLKSSEWGEENPKWTEHVELCNAGIARNAIRLGDFKRGIQLARDSSNPALQKNCADILEQMKWQEAASLYELAGLYEASATVYLRCKSYKQAGELLKRIPNAPRLHLQYAKAREADGAFREAVVAYEAAHDWDSVVRLQLEKLGNIEEAVRVVRETKSIDGAKMIAQYFTRINDHASAIQFLVLSKCLDTAFQLAQKHRKMELYAEYIGQDANVSEYQSIAHYFENEKNWYMAGKFYLMAKQYEKAIRNLLRSPYTENSPALDLALEAVGLADDTRLTHLLIVYLMGEADGVPKDARHLFRLYMVLKQYKEAARTAVIIAREEQTAGNYRSAHDLLFSLVQELKQRDLRVPAEMADNLALLHSYVLAKVHVKHGDHVRAAKMLIRVAENISKFPSHVVPILTSTVIECQKAGLKTESFGYAAMLLRPEYREKLDPKHRRKFETLIRRPDRKPEHMGEDQPDQVNSEVDPATPCPSCSCLLVGSSLYCTECRNTLPYCIITGNHVIKNDFTVCPGCQFPAIYSEMMSFIENNDDPSCPMCSSKLSRDSVRRVVDPSKIINAWITADDDALLPAGQETE